MTNLSTTPTLPSVDADWQRWLDYGLEWAAFDWTTLEWNGPGSPLEWPQSLPTRARSLTLHAYREATPGRRWQALLEAVWPAYRGWYFSQGEHARPSLAECRARLEAHMPELVPTWERLVELAAVTGDAQNVGRMLTMWCPPAFAGGCSQVALNEPQPVLIRNYDWDPKLFEGVIASTCYLGTDVMGTSDCLWGLLDGVNGHGLAVSLTVGGRPGHAPGFAIPLVVRYLLETCATVDEAIATLERLPIAQAYNLTLVDTAGGHASVFVAPGEAPEVSALRAVTNHRLETVEHPEHARLFASVERQESLLALLDEGAGAEQLVEAHLRAPVRTVAYDAGFGTLYTAEYRPASGTVTYHWPERSWTRRFDDADAVITVELPS